MSAGILAREAHSDIPAGPLFSDIALTLDIGRRTEVLGPLLYAESVEDVHRWALPPLMSYTTDTVLDSTEFDFLYPILTYDRFGSEYRFQILQVLNAAGGQTQSATNAHRFSLFPFYLQQRSADNSRNYVSVLPFYGELRNRLFRDEIRYVMLPLYVRTQKRDVVTVNYLYPIFHVRHGDGLRGWQAWPLIGHETKTLTIRTNHWGDSQSVLGHDNWFALWPVFFNNRTGIGGTNEGRQQAMIPLYSYVRSPLRDSTSIPWPLGVTYTIDRQKKYRELGTPWPLIVFRRGETANTSRVWPFYSHATNEFLESDWILWPFYKYNRVHSDPLDRERTRILFFLYSDLSEKNTESGATLRRRDLWPLFTHRRDRSGNERLQILAPLEPVLPNNKSIERDYSPLWSIWRAEKNARTGIESQSFLWNLYRRERGPNGTKTYALFGLVQHSTTPERSHWRLFYLPGR